MLSDKENLPQKKIGPERPIHVLNKILCILLRITLSQDVGKVELSRDVLHVYYLMLNILPETC